MAGKGRDRRQLLGANPGFLAAVAAIFRRQHQPLLSLVVIAFGPTVIATLAKLHHLFGRQIGALLDGVELRPVLRQLIAPMLGRKKMSGGIEREALAIAETGGVTLGGRENLPRLISVIAPDAG